MTKLTNDFGPLFKGRAEYHRRPVPTQFLAGVGVCQKSTEKELIN